MSDADDGTYKGDGYILGLGVNLVVHWHLELTHLGTEIDDTVSGNRVKLETESTQLLINYYWY